MNLDFSAGAQALGYFYQVRQALCLLLDGAEETELSIETLDDVVFEEGGSPIELLQLKHHIKKGASLDDSSEDLWRTIRVWSSHTRAGKLSFPHTRLALITMATAKAGSVASLLGPGSSRDSAQACQKLREVASSSRNERLQRAFEAFRALSAEQQQALVEAIRVLPQSSDIVGVSREIRKRIQIAVNPEHVDGLFQRLEGWWFGRVVDHLVAGSAHPIGRLEVHRKIVSIAEQFRPDALPIDFLGAEPPSPPDAEKDARQFVLQLKVVGVRNKRIEKAILDYYRAFEQRSKWAREDLVLDEELKQYEDKLVDEWERQSLAFEEELQTDKANEESCKQLGRRVYNWVDRNAHIPIRPRVTEAYVMRGSYHMLADADPPRVWWHPLFEQRLLELLGTR